MAEERSMSSGPVLCDICSGPAVKSCLTCMASYCEIHVKDHYTSPDLDSHELQDLHHHSLCQQHHKELEFYCRTDQSAICSRCFLHDHNGHDVVEQSATERTKSLTNEDIPPPGPIQFVSVQPDSVSLRWSPPEGAPGHRTFKVTWTAGQKDSCFSLTGTSLEVTDLTPGEKYHFTVATLSQDGRQSTPVEGTVYTEVPPPQNLQVEVTSPTASVTWTKPAGVDQVTYLLEIIKDKEVIRTVQRNSCQYTITGLQVDADYTINVTTLLSDGSQSQPAIQTFRAEVPPPQNLQVEVTSPTATVTWTKPAGVDQVTYLLDIVKGQKEIRTVQRNSCHYTITGLQTPAEYTVNVTTILSSGCQSKPTSRTFNIGVPPPGPIQFVSVQPDSVSLRWSPPEGAPGHRTFNVTWRGDLKHDSFSVTGTTLERIWLTPGEKYHFTVATLSQDGHQSIPVEGAVYTEVPPPQNLQVVVDLKSLTASVTWTKPVGVDQVTYLLEIIRDQEVIRTVHTAPCLVNCSSQREHTITDLQMLVSYAVNVTTVLSNGRHSKPAYHIFRPEVPPPQDLQVDVNMRSLTAYVSWTKPAGVDQETYLLQIINNQGYKHTIQTHSCYYTITDIQILLNYTVNVTTVISDGRHSKPASHIFRPGPPLRIVLIGKSGAGKSQSGKSILRNACFPRASECKALSTRDPREMKVIDTPAIFHTSRHETIIKKDIQDCIRLSRPGPHAFLLVIKLGCFTKDDQNAVRALQEIFGEKVKDHIIVLFTHGDQLDGQTIEEYVSSSSEELQELVRSCGWRVHVFDNTKDISDGTQAFELSRKIDEMVAPKGGQHFTNEMYIETTKVIKERVYEWDSDSSEIDQNLSFLPLLQKRVAQFHKTLSQ